jgi:hypothetical protein
VSRESIAQNARKLLSSNWWANLDIITFSRLVSVCVLRMNVLLD